MIDQLFQELSALPQVEAIAQGGSRAGTEFDAKSDYDVYLYCTAPVPQEARREILSRYCAYMEIDNHFWEQEENCTLNDGVDIDILYRDLDGFTAGVAAVVEGFEAHNGYTTCMWHNLKTCRILYDEKGRLTAAQKRFDVPYPAELKHSIIERNLKLLRGTLPAYVGQIRKAASRSDLVSVNHRTAALLESYFDILFALNGQTHPGEKRLVSLCRQHCSLLPDRFEENLDALWRDMFTDPVKLTEDLAEIIRELEKLL